MSNKFHNVRSGASSTASKSQVPGKPYTRDSHLEEAQPIRAEDADLLQTGPTDKDSRFYLNEKMDRAKGIDSVKQPAHSKPPKGKK